MALPLIMVGMADFLLHNATAVFSLIGVFAGGFLSSISSWLLRRRDLTLKVWEKLLDRRITAHENVIRLAMKMRVMVSLGGADSSGEVVRAPELLKSRETFEAWMVEFAEVSGPASTWLSTAAKRELNFIQDYFVTLYILDPAHSPSPEAAEQRVDRLGRRVLEFREFLTIG